MLNNSARVSAFILFAFASVFAQSGAEAESGFSGWLLPAVLLVLAGVAVFAFLRFRSPKGKEGTLGLAGTEDQNAAARPPRRSERPASANLSEIPQRTRTKPESKASTPERARADISNLPVSSIQSIERPSNVEPLPDSDDEGLLATIDELQDDTDADSEYRLVALRVLGGFKTRNSIEALSQIALYDLSSNMRSKALAMLAEIDHESVFEAIVLACADPSREVRAAGARALVNVTFDRADAWAGFAFSDDQYMSRQVARAAVESGIAERSFDRLAMRDAKAAYEAFALVYLLVKSGETEKIFEAIKGHRDVNVRLALLHSLKVANVAEVIPHLSAFIAAEPMTSEVADKAREAMLGINAVPIGA